LQERTFLSEEYAMCEPMAAFSSKFQESYRYIPPTIFAEVSLSSNPQRNVSLSCYLYSDYDSHIACDESHSHFSPSWIPFAK